MRQKQDGVRRVTEQDLVKGPNVYRHPKMFSPTSRASWLECRIPGHGKGPVLNGPCSFRPLDLIPRGMRITMWFKGENNMVMWKHIKLCLL